MNRRRLLALVGCAAIARPCPPSAKERMRRVGVLIPLTDSDPRGPPRLAVFRDQLQKLGWSEGRNLQTDLRWGAGDDALTGRCALELVALAPDVIVVQSNQVLSIVHAVTSSVPIVAAYAGDLVESGFVKSLAHPDGNVTGFSWVEYSIGGKWPELLKTMAPHVTRAAIVHYPGYDRFLAAIEKSAASSGIDVTLAPVRDGAEITAAIAAFGRGPNGGLIVHPHPLTSSERRLIAELAAQYRLPAIYPYRSFVVAGGLMSYGIDVYERWRSAAGYVDLILRGARVAELPVQTATKFELVINLKAAKALGLAVPPRLIAGADEVIE